MVVVGAHHRINGGVAHPASHIRNHPNYNSISLAFDISMVRVQSPFLLTDQVALIPLEREFISTFSNAQVSGWGQVNKLKEFLSHFKTIEKF